MRIRKLLIVLAIAAIAPMAAPAQWSAAMMLSKSYVFPVVPPSGGVASIDFSNLDPNDSKLHAPATVNSAEVTRMWVTMNPFYPVASSVTWSLSGANTGGFTLASTTGFPGQLLAKSTGTAAGTYTDLTITANVGGQVLSATPTILVHSGTKATCGSGSTISSAITTAGSGGVVILDSCTYTGQIFTALNNQRIQGSGVGKTLLDGTSVTTALTDQGPTGVTIDSVGITGYANVGTTNCDTGAGNSYAIRTDDGWVVENSSITNSGCDAITVNWAGSGVKVFNNAFVTPQRNGMYCGPPPSGGTFIFKGNEIDRANQGSYSPPGGVGGTVGGLKCFAGTGGTVSSITNILNNYIHNSLVQCCDQGDSSTGIWVDTVYGSGPNHINIQGNTVLNNGRSGISDEDSCGADISHNFIKGNTGDPNVQFSGARAIMLRQSGSVNVHDNNVEMPASGSSYASIEFEPAPRAAGCSVGVGVNMYSNSITFVDTSSFTYGYPIFYGNHIDNSNSESGMSICSGLASCNGGLGGPNHFHDLAPNINSTTRYSWNDTLTTSQVWNFATYKANSGQDTNSTLDAVDGTTGITGCLHIACTGAGL